jgi:CheY-like chemotaxis protein
MGRILIADDHDALRRGLVRGLTEGGHDVDEASNGNAAIERLHDSYFDVVLSDLKMGGSDGLDVLRTARALHPTTSAARSRISTTSTRSSARAQRCSGCWTS